LILHNPPDYSNQNLYCDTWYDKVTSVCPVKYGRRFCVSQSVYTNKKGLAKLVLQVVGHPYD